MEENTEVIFSVFGDNITYALTFEVAPKDLRLSRLLKSKISEVCRGDFKYLVKSEFEEKSEYKWIQDGQKIPTKNGAVVFLLKPMELKDYCNMDYWLSSFNAKSEIHKDKDA